ncbi:MAG TPA: histidine phosphatase family protein [Acidimicrobiia bacterium]|jgi:probable phosphoglycerate mutase|nr:histidine phosphatase family protein [Acidimicrobiia bacterium]
MNELWIVRHGETEWSAGGRHTSRTEVALTKVGRAQAAALAAVLATHPFGLVLTSPRVRARETAAAAGFADAVVDDDLQEWDYGELEGVTTTEIRGRGGEFASWSIWDGPVPGGETIEQVAVRARRVSERAAAAPGDVLCFGHAHCSRVLAAVALGFDPDAGSRFVLDPATISVVGSEHERRALRVWNARPG